MSIQRNHVSILLLSIVLLLGGCSQQIAQKTPSMTPIAEYNVVSSINYFPNLCSSVGSGPNTDKFKVGVRLILKDKETDETLDGYALVSTADGSSTQLSLGSYLCEENPSSRQIIVSSYSQGHAPMMFEFNLPKNKLTTIEVKLLKSGVNGQSCFDNIEVNLLEANNNETKAEEISAFKRDRFFTIVKEQFELDQSDYDLQYSECDMGRGGYIKAKGVYEKDGSPFELYYHEGWCSSGGTDCESTSCFKDSEQGSISCLEAY
ncbi:hypothetical protein CL622_07925 [archaeon]|nr:hypothetical protein [archaeon]|tara:strand:+ start:704 stop:1489 length:786 start_codon:yes stop_codon:yes gene_type:complete